jgi:hypothetical protein
MPTASFPTIILSPDGETSQIISLTESNLRQKAALKKFVQKIDGIGVNSRRIEPYVPRTFLVRRDRVTNKLKP